MMKNLTYKNESVLEKEIKLIEQKFKQYKTKTLEQKLSNQTTKEEKNEILK